ncbi:MAG: SAM-dependent chlorinase/fluorinase [Desulfobacteraceae bacterium]|jgi:S-adenosylmethionine hydrolase|nr:SAM-dependent chlorinase/fluorinase [Desulfobacteraceae bacterium]
MSIITLLTDFGTSAEYAGLMKGVILSINPSAAIVDITHQIDSQDIVQAAFTICSSYEYFPDSTVHLIVVDPGVGSQRSLLAFEMKKQFFIAPDNGVLTLLFDEGKPTALVRITNTKYFLASVSQTFHGRDIIAPVGAHLSVGLEVRKLGDEICLQDAVQLDNLCAHFSEKGELVGKIVAVDNFGNLITNIDFRKLEKIRQAGQELIQIKIGSHVIRGLSETYSRVESNTSLALVGSRGYLEIAVNMGNAAQVLNVEKGTEVRVMV